LGIDVVQSDLDLVELRVSQKIGQQLLGEDDASSADECHASHTSSVTASLRFLCKTVSVTERVSPRVWTGVRHTDAGESAPRGVIPVLRAEHLGEHFDRFSERICDQM